MMMIIFILVRIGTLGTEAETTPTAKAEAPLVMTRSESAVVTTDTHSVMPPLRHCEEHSDAAIQAHTRCRIASHAATYRQASVRYRQRRWERSLKPPGLTSQSYAGHSITTV
jgi:hypothetical protein